MDAPQPPPLRLVAWNILHGGSSRRLPHIALELVSHDPDLVVISEFRPTLGGQILAVLADRGLRHLAEADAGISPSRNRILIASRFPLQEVDTEPMPPCLARRVLVRRLSAEVGHLLLTAAHLPDDWTPAAALHGWAWLTRHALENRNESHIILGDLNGSRDPGQPGGAPAHVAQAMGRLWTGGYVDAFDPARAGGERVSQPETTWKSHWGHELRLDHAILSAPLSGDLAGAEYAHSPRENGVSDHSAVIVSLALPRRQPTETDSKIAKNHVNTAIEPMSRPCLSSEGVIKRRGSRRESKLFKE